MLELLQSSRDETRSMACQLMASLANNSSIAEAAIEKKLSCHTTLTSYLIIHS